MGEGVVQIYGVTAQFRIEKIMGKLLKLPCILCLIQVKAENSGEGGKQRKGKNPLFTGELQFHA